MELKKAQKMCKLEKKEYNQMLGNIMSLYVSRKNECHKTCVLVLGVNEFFPGVFTRNIMPNENMPFISRKALVPFNPYYDFLIRCYPNNTEEILKTDTTAAYNDILSRLVKRNMDFVLQDDLTDYNYTLALINFIVSSGYDLQIFINKKKVYQNMLLMIKDYAIKRILHQPVEKLDIKNFMVARFMDMLKKGEISWLTIYDNFMVFNFYCMQGKVASQCYINHLGDQNDKTFDEEIRKLQDFINANERFLQADDLMYLNELIMICLKDFYERMDFNLFCEEKRGR